jgi:hypothetical protein
MAHRVAGIAATHLQRDLGLRDGEYVDVMASMRFADLAVMAQPMPRLFGVYLPPTSERNGGILLNSGLDEATIRHTAAHEWGHHTMGHGRCFGEDLDPLASSSRLWTAEEKQAEAFAAWFLMPIKAVKRGLARLDIDRPRCAADAYQLSLHLGTSLRGTIRHLTNLRLVAPDVARGWTTVPPARLRAQLCGGRTDLPARVWDLGAAACGSRLHVHVGDRLLVRGVWHAESDAAPAGVEVSGSSASTLDGPRLQLDISGRLNAESVVKVKSAVDGSTWSVTLAPTPAPYRGLLSADHGSSNSPRRAKETHP